LEEKSDPGKDPSSTAPGEPPYLRGTKELETEREKGSVRIISLTRSKEKNSGKRKPKVYPGSYPKR